jgi:twitching motility protein PilT
VQVQLSATLQGVISQRLLPAIPEGRVAAFEVLVATEAVRNLVREGKTRQLRNVIQTSRGEHMQTLENDLTRLVAAGVVSYEEALKISAFPRDIQAKGPMSPEQRRALGLGGQVPVPAYIR